MMNYMFKKMNGHIEALSERDLVVKRSSLPGAGKGLFTKKPIPKGTRIAEYKGKLTNWKEANHREGKNGFLYYINRNTVIDAFTYKKAPGRYANDARGITKLKGFHNNATYVEDGNRVFIEATKDIPANSEIFVDYGRDYWKVIRHNRRLEEEKKRRTK